MAHKFDAVWVGCGDGRLRKARNAEMEKMKLDLVDIPAPPGGALALVSKNVDPAEDTARQLGIYAGLHKPGTIVLEVHYDCGAVRELLHRTFANEAEERGFLSLRLADARDTVAKLYPDKKIVGYIVKPGDEKKATKFEKIF